MGLFLLGLIVSLIGLMLLAVPSLMRERALAVLAGIGGIVLGVGLVLFSSAMSVRDDQGGLIIRHFGPDLPANRVVASNGEKGPQAEILGPGWHFGYWPWLYTLEPVDCVTIKQGQIGTVVALDGKSLPQGMVYAKPWTNADEMIDGKRFLTESDAALGVRGPQMTVLSPGRYRYNPRLFAIDQRPTLTVDAGEVAVVKANAGNVHVSDGHEKAEIINGTALVPKGNIGIWREALAPGAYNLHPDAYSIIKVQTTNRIYTYQDKKWAIKVRSKDGFTFPVDVRVSVTVSAADAAYLVAMLANPDKEVKDDQEDEKLQVLESKVILPLIRTIFRNVAEGMNALQFVNSRTEVERIATTRMREELQRYRLATEGVFIGNIELDESAAGKALLATQTDRELALNQQQTFTEKKKAEESRATFIKAQEEAEQQRQLAQATYQVQVKEQAAKAREAEAKGEAQYIRITADARKAAYEAMASAIGSQGVVSLELLKLVADGKVQITPQVMLSGQNAGPMDALAGTLLRGAVTPAPAPAR